MSQLRTRRVAEEIQRVVSERILRGLKEPVPGFLTIREVQVNRDFTQAKVFYSVIGSDADKLGAANVLESQRGMLRREVGRQVRLRNTPELLFIADETGERAARIHELLQDVAPAEPSPAASALSGGSSDDEDGDADEDDEDD